MLYAVDSIGCRNMADLSLYRFLLRLPRANGTDQISSPFSWMAESMFLIPMSWLGLPQGQGLESFL